MKEKVDTIKNGSTIITAKPFAFVLSSKHRFSRCDNCLKSGKLSKCSGCQYVYYCDRTCQRESWSVHKSECPNLKRISPRVLPDAARLMARIIVKLKNGGADEVGYYTETNYRKFKDLMSHYSDIKQDKKRMEHFTSLCGVLFEYLGKTLIPNSAELMGIYGRICVNSFNILDPDMNSIAVGIYLGPSIIDHSCIPNAIAVFEGTTIIIRTLQDLPRLDWSQIRISYIDLLNSTEDRRAELKDSYYFWCNCQRCLQPEPFVAAATCPHRNCTNPCSPDIRVCSDCGQEFPHGFKEKFDQVTEFTAHHLQNMKSMAYLDISKMCLMKQEGILHPFNLQRVRTIESAFEAAVNLNVWEDAKAYAIQLIPGYLMYYGHVHPLTGLLHLMLGKILLYLGESKCALEKLKEASAILCITHGERHSLFRESLRPLMCQATAEVR
ncbi:histone-lysine N-methyltransferase SMYD3 isoform X2 [Cephus cinctus]|uniref:Histone-lysine N-methyltransferase SMYD3 isoform X2 n=1 Tax=Cephus cinctus TaxID=211228 RepID=A0AAJ7C241_CEPCN|nr:histone-lysine N-methyltransferase SMYD3 isoform X2 [Cephus cinctus]XP_015599199.1 histone-lysine N-methyltransferase SMYD3 isoform X2 [Cephus cinctus]XP_015599200.1 histone-lysine N-methyltransferase SMYD3 isoform X2 [Cephus cinctus]